MYEVSIKNGSTITYIHRGKTLLTEAKVVKGINTIDSFTFTITPNNEGYSLINDFTTLVNVYNRKTGKYEFMGRVLMQREEMTEEGFISKSVTCESLLGFLCDSVTKFYTLRNWTVSGLFNALISDHNAQVEEYKKFTVGTITATDDNDNLYLQVDRANTWQGINENLIDKIGGELQFRVENGVTYIDYLAEIGTTKATVIKLRRNMKSITRESDPTAFITRLIPYGAKKVDAEGKETEERVDITSVNNGLNYIDDTLGIAAYGLHIGYEYWDDVTTPQILKTKAINWLNENNKIVTNISVDAVELALLGLDIDYIDLYNKYPIKNDLMGIDETLRVIKKTVDLLTRGVSAVEFGETFKTLTQKQAEKNKEIDQAIKNSKKVENIIKNYVTNTQLNEVTEVYSVDLSQSNLLIPTLNDKKPLETKTYNVNYYGYFKGSQINPTVTISGTNTGITVTKDDKKIMFAVNAETAITNATNSYTLTFKYTDSDGAEHSITKSFDVVLAIQGEAGIKGEDAITLSVTSSGGTIFKNTAIATTLTAHVYKAGKELTATEINALGTVKWYKDNGTTAVSTGITLSISAGDVDDKATYTAQLEG